MGMFGHFRLSLRLRSDRNTLGKGVSCVCVCVCVCVRACVCVCGGVHARKV